MLLILYFIYGFTVNVSFLDHRERIVGRIETSSALISKLLPTQIQVCRRNGTIVLTEVPAGLLDNPKPQAIAFQATNDEMYVAAAGPSRLPLEESILGSFLLVTNNPIITPLFDMSST